MTGVGEGEGVLVLLGDGVGEGTLVLCGDGEGVGALVLFGEVDGVGALVLFGEVDGVGFFPGTGDGVFVRIGTSGSSIPRETRRVDPVPAYT